MTIGGGLSLRSCVARNEHISVFITAHLRNKHENMCFSLKLFK